MDKVDDKTNFIFLINNADEYKRSVANLKCKCGQNDVRIDDANEQVGEPEDVGVQMMWRMCNCAKN